MNKSRKPTETGLSLLTLSVALTMCLSLDGEASASKPRAVAQVVSEQHGKSSVSLYDLTREVIGQRNLTSNGAARLLVGLGTRPARAGISDKFRSDLNLVVRTCGQSRNAVLAEIESVACRAGISAYTEFSATTYFMNNDISSFPQEQVNGYLESLAVHPLADFAAFAESQGMHVRPLVSSQERQTHYGSNPFSLTAFADEKPRLLVVQHETNAQIAGADSSPAVVKVSLFWPAKISK
jgi:hypothetical protein